MRDNSFRGSRYHLDGARNIQFSYCLCCSKIHFNKALETGKCKVSVFFYLGTYHLLKTVKARRCYTPYRAISLPQAYLKRS